MEFRTTDAYSDSERGRAGTQGNHPAPKVHTKPLRTCEWTKGEGREPRDEDLSSPVSFSPYYSPSSTSGVLWLSQSGELVIVPRVPAETTENVFLVLSFRQWKTDASCSARRWRSAGPLMPENSHPHGDLDKQRAILIKDQAWQTTLRASSAVQTYFMQTISTAEARFPLPFQSQPVSWPKIEPDTRISSFNGQLSAFSNAPGVDLAGQEFFDPAHHSYSRYTQSVSTRLEKVLGTILVRIHFVLESRPGPGASNTLKRGSRKETP